jgi:hypothetical protein
MMGLDSKKANEPDCFLSSVSNEFGTLRLWLANLSQRTKKCNIRHQDDFFRREMPIIKWAVWVGSYRIGRFEVASKQIHRTLR